MAEATAGAPQGTDATIIAAEDSFRLLSGADFGFVDPDETRSLYGMIITGTTGGTLYYDADGADGAGLPVAISHLPRTFTVDELANGNVAWRADANVNGSGVGSITFQVIDDEGALDDSANTLTIDVTPVNDAPTLSASTDQFVDFVEDAGPVALMQNVVLGDPDMPADFAGGSLRLQAIVPDGGILLRSGSNFLVNDLGGGNFEIAWQDGAAQVVLGMINGYGSLDLAITDFTAFATLTLLNDLIDDFVYVNASDAPSPYIDKVVLTISEGDTGGGGALTAVQIQGLRVIPQNDAPVAEDDLVTALEDRAVTFTAGELLNNDFDPDNDQLHISSVTAVSGGRVALIAGGSVVFTPDRDFNGTASFIYVVDDGHGGTDQGEVTVGVADVYDRPALAGVVSSVNLYENSAPVLLDADVNFTASEGHIAGGTLTISGLFGEDRVAIRDQGTDPGMIGVSGAEIAYGGIIIGSFAGGLGGTLTVTFNDGASVAAVEALIENLTYCDVSDNPAPSRSLLLNFTDGDGADIGPAAVPATFTALAGAANPFFGLDVGSASAPAFVDLDGDGDLDMVVGDSDFDLTVGAIQGPRSFRNDGGAFTELTGGDNPFSGLRGLYYAAPAFVDLDGDGDLDAVFGSHDGNLRVFANQGGAFSELTGAANTFLGLNVGFDSVPAFADLDGDGDLDLVLGVRQGILRAFQSDGGKFRTDAGTFLQINGSNPILNLDVGDNSTPHFVDLDGDGDVDAVIGAQNGTLRTFRNDGGAFHELIGSANPFQGVDVGTGSNPGFVDLDGDGDIDVVTGAGDGQLRSFVNNVPHGHFITINVTGINDSPVLAGLTGNAAFLSGGAPALLDGDVQVSDLDGHLGGAIFTVTGLLAEDRVVIRDQGKGEGEIGVSGSDLLFGGEVIGSFTGGVGTTLTVTLAWNAPVVAVESLIENLTYANVSDSPTASRTLVLNLTDSEGADFGPLPLPPVFVPLTAELHPFHGADLGVGVAPALVDLDGDGDQDAVIGNSTGTLRSFLNDGSGSFTELTGAANPFDGVDVGDYSNPAFADLDGDGHVDAIVGTREGTLLAFHNQGDGSFNELAGAANPFDGVNIGAFAAPAFVDLDGDGDRDLVVGTDLGHLRTFQNNGDNSFTELTGAADRYDGVQVGAYVSPSFVDFDGDGDLDTLVGQDDGRLSAFRNNGDGTVTFLTGAANPFNGWDLGNFSIPAFADLDGDGDMDAVIGERNSLQSFNNDVPHGRAITVIVTPPSPPVAVDDFWTAGEDRTVIFTAAQLVGNDHHGDSDALSIESVTSGIGGTAVLNGSGVAFTPDPDFNGTASFTYVVSDGNGETDDGIVTVEVAPVYDSPALTGFGPSLNVAENAAPALLAAHVTFIDLEGDIAGGALTVSGLLAEDRVGIRDRGTAAGEIGVSGADVTYGGVVIGTVAGGSGDTLTVTLGAAATAEAVEALIENLTYSDVSDSPTAGRTLLLEVGGAGDTHLTASFAELTGAANPFTGVAISTDATPSFVDLDGDGDLDAVAGKADGMLRSFRNDGGAFTELTGAANPFDGVDVGGFSAPAFADVDRDGDLDALVGASDGTLHYLRNDGGAFAELNGTGNPFDGVDSGSYATVGFADLDGDGDMDVVVGVANGTLRSFRNDGGSFTELTGTDNPFDGVRVDAFPVPNFADLDRDGDSDAVVGDVSGTLHTFRNDGGSFTELTGAANPFAGADVGLYSAPTLVDLDGDGDMDAVVADTTGTLHAFENITPHHIIQVNVGPQNDAPTLADLTAGVTFLENDVNAAPALFDGDVTFGDAEGNFDDGRLDVTGLLAEDRVTIRNQGNGSGEIGVAGDEISYGGTVIGSFVGGIGHTLKVTLNAAATSAAVDALIENLAYSNMSDTPTESRTLVLEIADGSGASVQQAIQVEVTPQAEPPVLGSVAGNLAYTENDAPTLVSDSLTLSDPGSANIESAAVAITAGHLATDLLTINGAPSGTSGTITWAYDAPSGTLILVGSAPVADYEALLRQVCFESGSDAPGTSRTLSWTVFDGEQPSLSQTTNVTLTEVNDAPFVDLDFLNSSTGTIAAYTEGDAPVLIAPRAIIFDPDLPANYAGYAVTAVIVGDGTPDDQLTILATGTGPGELNVIGGDLYYEGVLVGSFSGGADGTALNLVFNADACACAVEAATASIAFSNSADEPSTLDRLVLFFVSDGEAADSTTSAFATVHVTAFNAAPELAGLDSATTFSEDLVNSAPQLLAPHAALTDAENNLGGGLLSVSGLLPEDVVTIRDQGSAAGQIGISGADVTYGGAVIGTFAGGEGDTLTIFFSANASTQAVEALIENLAYANGSDNPTASRTLLLNIVDGGGADLGTGGATTGMGHFSAPAAPGPFDGVGVYGYAAPAFVDLDGDGDFDLAVGDDNGFLHAFRNDAGIFTELTGADNSFGGLDLEDAATPAFTDIDGDGDLDLVVGGDSGRLRLFGNDGGVFVERTGIDDPLAGIDVGDYSAPAFVDLDGDGDADLVVGNADGSLHVFENDGGAFTELVGPDNMFEDIGLGTYSAPAFVDIDGDGDIDLVLGNEDGVLRLFENEGGAFTELIGGDNPFNGVSLGRFATPSFFDFDGDGDLDAVIGQNDGTLRTLENGPPHGRQIVVNVAAVDDPAAAVNDPGHITDENAIVRIAVTDNDTDVDGGLKIVASVEGQAISVGAPVILASGAIVSLNADGTLSYDPSHAFLTLTNPSGGETGAVNISAQDSFSYKLNGGSSATVTVTVNGVANAADHLNGDSGANIITGTPHGDFFDLSQGGNDQALGLGGSDAYYFGAAYSSADIVNDSGGANDQIGLQGDYSAGVTLGTIAGIEAIAVLPGYSYNITTADPNVVPGGLLNVQATLLAPGQNLTFDGSAESDGRFMIYGGGGNDHLTGGAGNDGFYFGPGQFNGLDIVNGGAGSNDQLGLDGDYTITLGGNLTGIEAVVLLHGPAATPDHFNVTAADTLVDAGQTMTIFGLQVETAITFNGSAELDGAFRVFGGTNADTLTGGHGNDWIFGGNGADRLTGGAGNDIFYYDDVAQSTPGAVDNIADFTSGDKIDLAGIDAIAGGANDAFTFLGARAFTSTAGELRVVDLGSSNWRVEGDTDGDGVADFQLVFHTTDTHPITSGDFTL